MISRGCVGTFATGLGLLVIKIFRLVLQNHLQTFLNVFFREQNKPKLTEAQSVMTVHLHEASKVALETKVEFKRNVENSMNDLDKHMNDKVDEMMTDMKQRLMNEDMWKAFDIIVYLVGKLYTTYQNTYQKSYFRKCQ